MINKEVDVLTIRQHFPSSFAPTSSYWVFEQIRDLSEMGVNFAVISPQPYIPDMFRPKSKYPEALPYNDVFKGVSIFRPIHFRIPKYKFYSITNKFLSDALVRSSKNIGFRLIHAHFGNDGVAAMKIKKMFNVPLITSFYGYDLSDELEALLPFYKKFRFEGDLFLALSQDMKRDLLNIGFPEEKIVIHHLGINFSEIDKFSVKRYSDNVNNFLIVARFTERKGIHDSILAFRNVIRKYPKKTLRIVGNGPYKSKLVTLVEELKISENVVFVDNFKTSNPRQTVLNEIANCDAFLLTSYITEKGSKEGTPIVLMEAQALGKPCIGTKHAGIPEIVLNNHSGLLVRERDIDGITNALLKLIEYPEMAKNMGENGKEHIKKEFNNSIQSIRLNNIYRSVLKQYFFNK